MRRSDRIKLNFMRNWMLPGKERLAHFFTPSKELKESMKDGIIWLAEENLAIYTTADNYIEWTILSTGTYEAEISKLIRLSVRPGDICLDIGGNIGLQSIRMSQSAGASGRVYAFEPLNYLQEKLRRNLTLNRVDNVTIFPYALSDQESEIEYHIDRNAWNQGTFNLKNTIGDYRQKIEVRIADYIPEIAALPAISLIKVDVEGFELHVLRGLKRTIQKHRPRLIFEYDSDYWKQAGSEIGECFAFLTGYNYQVYQIHSVGCEQINKADDTKGGNLFCIPA
jgi:FkbM family methyltransferase